MVMVWPLVSLAALSPLIRSLRGDSFKNANIVKNSDGEEVGYFSGQKYNEILAHAAENVSSYYRSCHSK